MGRSSLLAALLVPTALVPLLAAIVLAADWPATRAALAVAVVLTLAAPALCGLDLRQRGDDQSANKATDEHHELSAVRSGVLSEISNNDIESRAIHRLLLNLTIG